ncbi:hypothetical protein PoB_007693200 [Plakobranchus ocellatus]|uniref:Uncharacterized protein n=1 Tax=Plakobranchus ocellatus TaxID=259542 RepID=A0AAV4E1H3_9GAST|nr:hypothetical protein PoB_007693200 [Plakobranchus ocellatus]
MAVNPISDITVFGREGKPSSSPAIKQVVLSFNLEETGSPKGSPIQASDPESATFRPRGAMAALSVGLRSQREWSHKGERRRD